MIDLVSASPYLRLFRGRTIVIKVGGACLARPALLAAVARQIAVVEACGARPVVVHGGGPQTDELQRALGEEPRKIGGRRVTTEIALRALVASTREDLHPRFCAALAEAGASPAPCEDALARAVVARRRPPVATEEGPVDFGLVGDVARVDPKALRRALDAGRVPVLCPPVSDGGRGLLNANADLVAAHVAAALGAAKLVLVTSEAGVLVDPRDPRAVASTLTLDELEALERAGVVGGGMKVKASAARLALAQGVERVHVVSGILPDALLGELYTTHGTGTLITASPEVAPAPPAAPAGASRA